MQGEGRRAGYAPQPAGPQAAASLPPPAPTFLALAGSPHGPHCELGEGKGLLGRMRSAEAPPSCHIV